MIQDPTDEYIRAITSHCDLTGKEVLEVGCGTGRITRDLARHAAHVVAVDPDDAVLAKARPAQEAAIQAMHGLAGWTVGETVHFRVAFLFADEDDFIATKLPGFGENPEAYRQEVREFLARHRMPEGVVLDAGRRLNVLRRG